MVTTERPAADPAAQQPNGSGSRPRQLATLRSTQSTTQSANSRYHSRPGWTRPALVRARRAGRRRHARHGRVRGTAAGGDRPLLHARRAVDRPAAGRRRGVHPAPRAAARSFLVRRARRSRHRGADRGRLRRAGRPHAITECGGLAGPGLVCDHRTAVGQGGRARARRQGPGVRRCSWVVVRRCGRLRHRAPFPPERCPRPSRRDPAVRHHRAAVQSPDLGGPGGGLRRRRAAADVPAAGADGRVWPAAGLRADHAHHPKTLRFPAGARTSRGLPADAVRGSEHLLGALRAGAAVGRDPGAGRRAPATACPHGGGRRRPAGRGDLHPG